MSIIDTSTWSPDSDLNVDIEGIPLNADASIQQTWQAIQVLMAALKGDTNDIKLTINQPDGTTIVATNQTLTVVDNSHVHTIANVTGLQTALNGKASNVSMQGATASADGASGLVPAPEAGDQDKMLKGDGTWGNAPAPNLGTASRAVQTDANGDLAASSVTATELGHLSGVTSAVQTQLDAKAADSGVVHLADAETVSGTKTFSSSIKSSAVDVVVKTSNSSAANFCGGSSSSYTRGGKFIAYGSDHSSSPGCFDCSTGGTARKSLFGKPDGTLTWDGNALQTASDERLKTPMSAVPDEVLDAWEAVGWGQFQFIDAVKRKGDHARLHLGLIAQRVKAVFEAHGLNACTYGILCHEEREADGKDPGVDLWMVRYEEALAMEAACQRRRASRLESKLKALDDRLAALEVLNG